jgi:hypothetical protein
MNKKEFDHRLYKELELRELALVNLNIYWNPDHVQYWQDYKGGEYDRCYEFLMANRHLLTLKNTPVQFRKHAKQTLAKLRGSGKKRDFVKISLK